MEEKIWILQQESNFDGVITFNTILCKNKEAAIKYMQKEITELLTSSNPYKEAQEIYNQAQQKLKQTKQYETIRIEDEKYEIRLTEDIIFLRKKYDEYYEYITIEEKDIWK